MIPELIFLTYTAQQRDEWKPVIHVSVYLWEPPPTYTKHSQSKVVNASREQAIYNFLCATSHI